VCVCTSYKVKEFVAVVNVFRTEICGPIAVHVQVP
jgi:hypothetical protein